jgi:hypothetical protein
VLLSPVNENLRFDDKRLRLRAKAGASCKTSKNVTPVTDDLGWFWQGANGFKCHCQEAAPSDGAIDQDIGATRHTAISDRP